MKGRSKVRIGHLTSDDFGGVSTMLFHLLTCSRRHGGDKHEAVIADVNFTYEQCLSRRLGPGQYISVPNGKLSRIRWLLRHANDFDVLVAHKTAWYFWLGVFATLFPWRAPKLVAVIHDSLLFEEKIQFREKVTNQLLVKVYQEIIVVREDFKRNFEVQLGRSSGVTYISNGLPMHPDVRMQQRASSGFTLLSLTRLDDVRKDIGSILQAMWYVHDPEIRLIVGGEGRYKAHWMEMTSHLSLNDAVEFVGEIKDITRFFQQGNVLVLSTTFGEGTPMVLLEAMASGTPVLASRNAVPDWAIRERLCLTFEPGNYKDLSDVIQQLKLTSAEEMDALAKRAQRYVQSHFDVTVQLERYQSVFNGHTLQGPTPASY